MKHILATLLLFVPLVHAQTVTGSGTANYLAKWNSSSTITTSALCQSASGGLVGIATCFPTQRLQVNSGDALVKGVKNFTASGQVARYFVGDTNHALGAAFGAGLFFSTFKNTYAMVIKDTSGFVGIGTSTPAALLDVSSSSGNVFNLISVHDDNLGGSFTVDTEGQALLHGGSPFAASLRVGGTITSSATSTDELDLICCGFGSGTIHFPDGTVQTTAYPGTAAAVQQASALQQLQRDRDNLAQLVRQLQARVDRLERSHR